MDNYKDLDVEASLGAIVFLNNKSKETRKFSWNNYCSS